MKGGKEIENSIEHTEYSEYSPSERRRTTL